MLLLLDAPLKSEREKFFGQRVSSLVENTSAAKDAELDPEVRAATEMGLPEFETYIEMIVGLRGPFHRQYITECIDSLLLKNRTGAFIAQGRTKKTPRRFVLDSRLLEVLLQIIVLRQAVVADAVQAFWQHVDEEAADELVCGERHALVSIAALDAVVLPF